MSEANNKVLSTGQVLISYFHGVEIYHTATPNIISHQRYIIENNNKLWYNQLDKLEFTGR